MCRRHSDTLLRPILEIYNIKSIYILNNLEKWLRNNCLFLNPTKTVYMIISNYQNTPPEQVEFRINNENCKNETLCTKCAKFDRVLHTRYLGLHIDYLMKCEEQVMVLTKRNSI